jgi:hypothetical protein
MDPIEIRQKEDGKLHIEGFPDAEAVVTPNDNYIGIEKMKSLALHGQDLTVALETLEAINRVTESAIQVFLWEYAVVKVTKCFKKSNARESLQHELIHGGDPMALGVVKYFLSMRDKFIVHDDNGFSDCDFGLIIASPKKSYAIEKVVTPSFSAVTLDKDNYSNLHLVITKTLEWVRKEYDQLAKDVTEHYEAFGRDRLKAFPPMALRFNMSADDIHKNRTRK